MAQQKEKEVLNLIVKGKPNKEIASTLFMSVASVKGYVRLLLARYGAENRTELTNFILSDSPKDNTVDKPQVIINT